MKNQKKEAREEEEYRLGLFTLFVSIVIALTLGVFVGWWVSLLIIGIVLAIFTILVAINRAARGNLFKRSVRHFAIIFEMIGYLG